MNTIQIRKARPSVLAAALALLLTMLFVYVVARPALPGQRAELVAARQRIATEIRMEGLQAQFQLAERCTDRLQARILAAKCAQNGGAGLVLQDGKNFAVIWGVGDQGDVLSRSASGLTLRLRGSAAELAAVTDAVAFLRAQATETGALAGALESGDTDAASVAALMRVYQTQGQRVMDALDALGDQRVVAALRGGVASCLTRIQCAVESSSPSVLRLVHAAACAQWLELLEELGG